MDVVYSDAFPNPLNTDNLTRTLDRRRDDKRKDRQQCYSGSGTMAEEKVHSHYLGRSSGKLPTTSIKSATSTTPTQTFLRYSRALEGVGWHERSPSAILALDGWEGTKGHCFLSLTCSVVFYTCHRKNATGHVNSSTLLIMYVCLHI